MAEVPTRETDMQKHKEASIDKLKEEVEVVVSIISRVIRRQPTARIM